MQLVVRVAQRLVDQQVHGGGACGEKQQHPEPRGWWEPPPDPPPRCCWGLSPLHITPGSPELAARGDGRAAASHGTLTVAGEGEGFPQAVTQHRHLQADAVAQLLGAEVDGTPHHAGEGIVLGAVARSQPAEAGTGQRCCLALGFCPTAPKNACFGAFCSGMLQPQPGTHTSSMWQKAATSSSRSSETSKSS